MRKALLALPVLAAVAFAGPALAAGTVVVTEQDLGVDWTVFTRDTGALAFSKDFGAPDGLGAGALQLSTPLGNDKATLTTAVSAPLSALSTSSYHTYRDDTSTATAGQVPALNVTIDANGAAEGGYAILVFEPLYTAGAAAVQDDVWQQWQAGGEAKWWSTRALPGVPSAFSSFVPLDEIIAANPDAVIQAVAVNQGGGNAGLLGAVDGVTVGGTTYDFEPRVYDAADCKDGGWETNFSAGQFVNQGDCVSFYASNGKTHG